MEKNQFMHIRIDLERDREYLLECHCAINYACDCPWAREVPYPHYRAKWRAREGDVRGFLAALQESMEDPRTIADRVVTPSGAPVGYLWAPFHGGDADFIWAEVQDLYVEEAHRNRGVALQLMRYAEECAMRNGARVIRWGTGCENEKSIHLHEKAGYYRYRLEYEKVLCVGREAQ